METKVETWVETCNRFGLLKIANLIKLLSGNRVETWVETSETGFHLNFCDVSM
ncbi:MAG: hypothetical protein H7834_12510 [Magnetococcus sp. YQC-9]